MFPPTHWGDVARAGDPDPQIRRDALGKLLARYLPAFRAYLIRRRRLPPDQADDLLQGFICDRVVADDLITRADRARGRFRAFVIVALDRYMISVYRAEHAAKRRPAEGIVNVELADHDSAPGQTDADIFDVAWAREVMQRAIRQMRRYCDETKHTQLWQAFQLCMIGPLLEGRPALPHAETVKRIGLSNPQQVSNLLVTAKRTFAKVLKEIVGEYAQSDEEVEAEMRDLWTILSHAPADESPPATESDSSTTPTT